jgi:hypothetical protein
MNHNHIRIRPGSVLTRTGVRTYEIRHSDGTIQHWTDDSDARFDIQGDVMDVRAFGKAYLDGLDVDSTVTFEEAPSTRADADRADVDDLVQERTDALLAAEAVGLSRQDFEGDSTDEIRRVFLAKRMPDLDLAGKGAAFVAGAFNALRNSRTGSGAQRADSAGDSRSPRQVLLAKRQAAQRGQERADADQSLAAKAADWGINLANLSPRQKMVLQNCATRADALALGLAPTSRGTPHKRKPASAAVQRATARADAHEPSPRQRMEARQAALNRGDHLATRQHRRLTLDEQAAAAD